MFFIRRDLCWWIFLIGVLKAVQGTISNTKHITRYNTLCTSPCNSKYKGSYWCYTNGASSSWEYCSEIPNEDIEGKKCKNKCSKNGKNYNWCWLVKGSWNYCGLVQNRLQRFKTRYGYECIDDCRYYQSKGYYYCNANNGWEYCSPSNDATIYGKACKDNSKCASHGYSYTWCYTKDGSWDYCGIIQWNSCKNTGRKRQVEEICMRDPANRIDVVYRLEPGNIATYELQGDLRRNAQIVIAMMDVTGIPQKARSNIVSYKNFRIDMQGIINRGNEPYYNLQLQINTPRTPGESTTYAAVLVPQAELGNQYINKRRLRNAFIRSLLEKKIIQITVTRRVKRNGRSLGGEDEILGKYFGEDEQIEENVNEEKLEGFERELE